MLAGALVSGVLLAIMMANAGGAWDNAKNILKKESMEEKEVKRIKLQLLEIPLGSFKDTSVHLSIYGSS